MPAGHVRLVFSRELLDYRRQRRVWRRLFLQPFVVMLLLAAPVLVFRSAEAREKKQTYTVAVEGDIDAVPGLRTALRSPPLRLREVDDGGRAVVARTAEAALVVPADAAAAVAGERRVALRVLSLPIENASRFGAEALRRRLAELRTRQAVRALAARGVDPAVLTPFALETVDLTATTDRGTRFGLAQALPVLLVIQLFGLMAASEERIAGAKDRRVLEPLLLLPLRRTDILLGIGAATMSAGFAAAAVLFLPLVLALTVAVAAISGTVAGPAEVVGGSLLGIVLFGIVFTAIGLYAGARAHSGGEGTIFITLAQVAVFALVSATPFLADVAAQGPILLVPVLGPLLLVRDTIAAGFAPTPTLLSIGGSVAAAALLVRRSVTLIDAEASVLRSSAR